MISYHMFVLCMTHKIHGSILSSLVSLEPIHLTVPGVGEVFDKVADIPVTLRHVEGGGGVFCLERRLDNLGESNRHVGVGHAGVDGLRDRVELFGDDFESLSTLVLPKSL